MTRSSRNAADSSVDSIGNQNHFDGSGSDNSTTIDENINLELLDVDMWKIFNTTVTNEMIITKAGRKLFPVVKFRIRGLDTQRMYSVSVEFEQQDTHRWKYTEGGWTHAGKAEPAPINATYLHPNSPKFGNFWMTGEVDFSKVKITNKTNSHDMIRLNSLHLYEPIVRITRVDPLAVNKEVIVFEKHLPMCQFMAVTSYQNTDITQLKIKHNPFAKGFQEQAANRIRMEQEEQGRVSPPPNYYCNSNEVPEFTPNMYTWQGYVASTQSQPATSNQHHSAFYFPSSISTSNYSARYNPYARPAIKTEKGLDLSHNRSSDYYCTSPQTQATRIGSGSFYSRTPAVAKSSPYTSDVSQFAGTPASTDPFCQSSSYPSYHHQYPPYNQEDLYANYANNNYYNSYPAGYGSFYSRQSSHAVLDQNRPQRDTQLDSLSNSSASPTNSTTSDQISPIDHQSFVY